MPEPMTCRELVEVVTDYFEGAMSELDVERFEKHLERCPGCRNYIEQLRKTRELVGQLDESHVSDEAREILLKEFRDWQENRADM